MPAVVPVAVGGTRGAGRCRWLPGARLGRRSRRCQGRRGRPAAVREPLALGPGNALYAAAWWRFARADRRLGRVRWHGRGRRCVAVRGDRDRRWAATWSAASVYAIAPDGAGGWFIAGHVQPSRRSATRRARAHRRRRNARPGVGARGRRHRGERAGQSSGTPCTSAASSRRSTDSDAPTSRRVDRVSGRLLPWNPRVDADVIALAATNGVLYAGGWFDRVDGTSPQRPGGVRRRERRARGVESRADRQPHCLRRWRRRARSQSVRTRCTWRAASPPRRGARGRGSPHLTSRPARRPRGGRGARRPQQ